MLLSEEVSFNSKRITIVVPLGCRRSFKMLKPVEGLENIVEYDHITHKTVIAFTNVLVHTTWLQLDHIVKKSFKNYLSSIDPGRRLDLNIDATVTYHLGEAWRGPSIEIPELLPFGYITEKVQTLNVCLDDTESFALETLIPRSIAIRYINSLRNHRKLIIYGTYGVGKSFLTQKLAKLLITRTDKTFAETIETFE